MKLVNYKHNANKDTALSKSLLGANAFELIDIGFTAREFRYDIQPSSKNDLMRSHTFAMHLLVY